MKTIYVAGPYRGETTWVVESNIRRAEGAGLWIAKLGAVPVIPHTMTRFFDGEINDQFWLDATMELLKRCDAIYLCPGWQASKGSTAELEHAQAAGKHIFVHNTAGVGEDIKQWIKQ